MIYYIATIEDSQVRTLKLSSGDNEPEGAREDGTTIVHIDFPIEDRFAFINTHFWDGEWKERVPSPNRHALWIENEWVWDHEDLLNDVRLVRNNLLSVCDWTQLPDVDLTEEQKDSWTSYRQALRDLSFVSSNITCLEDVVWPNPPA